MANLYLRTNADASYQGAAGIVDGDNFIDWVTDLCAQYTGTEKNNIGIMNNASTHMDEGGKSLIHTKGTWLIYSAPYSPDLSPIKYRFNYYEVYMKQYSEDYHHDKYYHLHTAALRSVSRDTAINEFGKCGIPFLMTSSQLKNLRLYFHITLVQ